MFIWSFLNVFSVIFVYLTIREITKKREIAFISALLVGVNTFILEWARSFLDDAFDPVLASLALFLYFLWSRTKNNFYLYSIAFTLGIAINHHANSIYFAFPFTIWLLYQTYKKNIKVKTFLLSTLIFLIVMFPYLNYLTRINIDEISSFLRGKYVDYNLEFKGFYLPNLLTTSIFPRILFDVLIPLSGDYWYFILVPAIFIAPIFSIILLKKIDNDLKFLIYLTYAILLLYIFSPMPVVNNGSFTALFVSFTCLLGKLLSAQKMLVKIIILSVFLILFLTNIPESYSRINFNRYQRLKDVWSTNINKLVIEGISYSSLQYTPTFDPFSKIKKIEVFECREDGIYSVKQEDIRSYNYYGNNTSRYDPDFFKNVFLTKKDIVVFGSECVGYSRRFGLLNTTQWYGFNNSYTRLNLPIELIDEVYGISIFKVV
jgi:4-amino-4-deoxy-L-arabinose transferase-like glycosyltransferase